MTPSDLPARSVSEEDVVAKLEALDDVMFPAIDGNPAALKAAPVAWTATVAAVGGPAVEETRREYLRYARDVWRQLRGAAICEPLRMLAVLKIIGMLMGDDV